MVMHEHAFIFKTKTKLNAWEDQRRGRKSSAFFIRHLIRRRNADRLYNIRIFHFIQSLVFLQILSKPQQAIRCASLFSGNVNLPMALVCTSTVLVYITQCCLHYYMQISELWVCFLHVSTDQRLDQSNLLT